MVNRMSIAFSPTGLDFANKEHDEKYRQQWMILSNTDSLAGQRSQEFESPHFHQSYRNDAENRVVLSFSEPFTGFSQVRPRLVF